MLSVTNAVGLTNLMAQIGRMTVNTKEMMRKYNRLSRLDKLMVNLCTIYLEEVQKEKLTKANETMTNQEAADIIEGYLESDNVKDKRAFEKAVEVLRER